MSCLYLCLAALFLPFAQAATYSHYNGAVPAGWSPMNPPDENSFQTFTLALTMQNIDQLELKLLDVSVPGASNYGQHWTGDMVNSFFAPSSKAVLQVIKWLETGGVNEYKIDGAFIDFAATIETANSLLNASYQQFTDGVVTKLRTLTYNLPNDIDQHIALIDPGLYIGSSKALTSKPAKMMARGKLTDNITVDASCEISITPACLRNLYNIGNYTTEVSSGSKIGFSSFLNESALYTDLFHFEELYGIPAQNISVILINNATNNQDAGTARHAEAGLDVQIIMEIAHPLPVIEYITAGSAPFVPNIDQPTAADNENEPWVPYLRYLLAQPSSSLPQVISNSYGDTEDSVPYEYAVLSCNLIGQLGLRGITVVQASGDRGLGASCLAPDNKTVEFNVAFPATCPYVTSVGGTINVSPEVAWNGSGGGFSNYFSRPSYQNAAVLEYLETYVSPSTLTYYGQYTNFSGRGYPDVAAHAAFPKYQLIYNGIILGRGGTSAAAPVWAGIVALLNDARLRANKSSLGWLNPLLYAYGAVALTDITTGYTSGCNGINTQSGKPAPPGSGIVPGARWNATKRWDPSTGCGTPDFQKLKQLVLSF